jgi:hypothetical protein
MNSDKNQDTATAQEAVTASWPPAAPDDPRGELDKAHRELQVMYPGLDWESPVNAAISRALEMGFEIGRDYEYRYPD